MLKEIPFPLCCSAAITGPIITNPNTLDPPTNNAATVNSALSLVISSRSPPCILGIAFRVAESVSLGQPAGSPLPRRGMDAGGGVPDFFRATRWPAAASRSATGKFFVRHSAPCLPPAPHWPPPATSRRSSANPMYAASRWTGFFAPLNQLVRAHHTVVFRTAGHHAYAVRAAAAGPHPAHVAPIALVIRRLHLIP